MTMENGQERMEEEIPVQARDTFEEMATQDEAREVDMPDQRLPTLAESMENSTDLTDMQYAMAKLFPSDVKRDSVMVARVAPDVFLASLHLRSVNEIMRSDPRQSIDVNEIYGRNYVELSIGLDGRGRIDVAELAGAAKAEQKLRDTLKTTLG